jgi:hypothetical protein
MGERVWKYDMVSGGEPSKEYLLRMKLMKRQKTIDTILNGGKPKVVKPKLVERKVEVPIKVSLWDRIKSIFKR